MSSKTMTIFIIGTAISLLIGSILLIGKVPLFLTIGSFIVVGALIVFTFLILRGKATFGYVTLAVMILLIISSSISNAHLAALQSFGSSLYIIVIDILMVLGFYIFPILYIVTFISLKLRDRQKR
ncbi:MAG: hypothetical protein QXL96_04330 [Ignisphaera sp.]